MKLKFRNLVAKSLHYCKGGRHSKSKSSKRFKDKMLLINEVHNSKEEHS